MNRSLLLRSKDKINIANSNNYYYRSLLVLVLTSQTIYCLFTSCAEPEINTKSVKISVSLDFHGITIVHTYWKLHNRRACPQIFREFTSRYAI